MTCRPACLAIAALMPALAVGIGCNSHREELPNARCRDERHCKPGEECWLGECRAQASATLRVTASSPQLGALLLTGPRDVDRPLYSSRTRLLANELSSTDSKEGTAVLRFTELPQVRMWALVWEEEEGEETGPCPGTRFAFHRLEDSLHARAALAPFQRWSGEDCYEPPPPLDYADRRLFARQ